MGEISGEVKEFRSPIREDLVVSLLHFPPPKRIPTEVWESLLSQIEGRIDRLWNIVQKIENATGIAYPRIIVLPFVVVHPDIGKIYFGSHNWMPDAKQQQIIPVIWLSAATLLYAGDDTLTSHLVHEFLHYVDRTIFHYRHFRDRKRVSEFVRDLKREWEATREEGYIEPKYESKLIDLAKEWIHERGLRELFLRYEGRRDMKERLSGDIAKNWLSKDLPTTDTQWLDEMFIEMGEEALSKKLVKFVYIDPAIVDRIST